MDVINMFEEMALNYFRSMPKAEKNALIKKIFESLSEEERLEIAKILVGKEKKGKK